MAASNDEKHCGVGEKIAQISGIPLRNGKTGVHVCLREVCGLKDNSFLQSHFSYKLKRCQ